MKIEVEISLSAGGAGVFTKNFEIDAMLASIPPGGSLFRITGCYDLTVPIACAESVYVIEEEGSGTWPRTFKIGKAKSPTERLKVLQTGNSAVLKIVALAPGGLNLESALHNKFKAQSKRGEFFTLNKRQFEELAECIMESRTRYLTAVEAADVKAGNLAIDAYCRELILKFESQRESLTPRLLSITGSISPQIISTRESNIQEVQALSPRNVDFLKWTENSKFLKLFDEEFSVLKLAIPRERVRASVLLLLSETQDVFDPRQFVDRAVECLSLVAFRDERKIWVCCDTVWTLSKAHFEHYVYKFLRAYSAAAGSACNFFAELGKLGLENIRIPALKKLASLKRLHDRLEKSSFFKYFTDVGKQLPLRNPSWLNRAGHIFPLEGGCYDSKDGCFKESGPDWGFTYKFDARVEKVQEIFSVTEDKKKVMKFFSNLLWRDGKECTVEDLDSFLTILAIYISGRRFDQTFLIIIGEGPSGKSAFVNVLQSLLNKSRHLPPMDFLKRGTEALQDLSGSRLVTISYPSGPLNPELVKALTVDCEVGHEDFYSSASKGFTAPHLILFDDKFRLKFNNYDEDLIQRIRCLELQVNFKCFVGKEWSLEEHGSKNILPVDRELAEWMLTQEAREALFSLLMGYLYNYNKSGKKDLPTFPAMETSKSKMIRDLFPLNSSGRNTSAVKYCRVTPASEPRLEF